jgi:hypothetical protein
MSYTLQTWTSLNSFLWKMYTHCTSCHMQRESSTGIYYHYAAVNLNWKVQTHNLTAGSKKQSHLWSLLCTIQEVKQSTLVTRTPTQPASIVTFQLMDRNIVETVLWTFADRLYFLPITTCSKTKLYYCATDICNLCNILLVSIYLV